MHPIVTIRPRHLPPRLPLIDTIVLAVVIDLTGHIWLKLACGVIIFFMWMFFVFDATNRMYIGFIERDGCLVVVTRDGKEMPRKKNIQPPDSNVTCTKILEVKGDGKENWTQ